MAAETINVEMPDGTVIEGVPEGTSQAELQRRLSAYSPQFDPNAKYKALQRASPELPKSAITDPAQREALVRARAFGPEGNKGWGAGIAPAAYALGGNVTDLATKMGASPEVAAGAGYGTNVIAQAIPALMSSYKFAGAAPVSMTEAPARKLMQSATKPSSTINPEDVRRAMLTQLQEGISPTPGGMAKASKLASSLNAETNAAIQASPETVSIARAGSRLGPLQQRALEQVNPQADVEAIRNVWDEFKTSPLVKGKTEIPVALANKLKSGTYTAIGNKAYGELGSASTEAQKQLARGLREEVIAKVPAIAEPLKREAALRNAMEVAATRAAIDANKNPLSLGTSIAAIMHDPLSAAGMWANASTPVKAMLARMLFTAGQPQVALPAAIAAKEAANQQRE